MYGIRQTPATIEQECGFGRCASYHLSSTSSRWMLARAAKHVRPTPLKPPFRFRGCLSAKRHAPIALPSRAATTSAIRPASADDTALIAFFDQHAADGGHTILNDPNDPLVYSQIAIEIINVSPALLPP